MSNNEEGEEDLESDDLPTLMTVEEEFLQREELQEIYEALVTYLIKQGKQERNRIILEQYLAGYNQEEIAKVLNIPAPVVGYVIRSIQSFARNFRRKKPGLSLPQSDSPDLE